MKIKKIILLGMITLLLSYTSVHVTSTIQPDVIDPEPWSIEI